LVHAWTEPTAAPPNGNVGAPINTGATAQTKVGQLGSTGGGFEGTGSVRIGYETLNSHSNGWLYIGDQNGTVYGSRGLAADYLYANSYSYSPKMYDYPNINYYVDPDRTSTLNVVNARGYLDSPIMYDMDNSGYYVDPGSQSYMHYGVFDYVYVGGYLQSPKVCIGADCRTSWPSSISGQSLAWAPGGSSGTSACAAQGKTCVNMLAFSSTLECANSGNDGNAVNCINQCLAFNGTSYGCGNAVGNIMTYHAAGVVSCFANLVAICQ